MLPSIFNTGYWTVATMRRTAMSDKLFLLSRAGPVNLVELTLPIGLDIDEFDRLNEGMLKLIEGEPHGRWVMDLSHLEYMGSATLGLMVNIRQKVKQAGGKLVLCGMSPRMVQIFRTCSLERLFKIVRSRQEAMEIAAW